MSCTCGGCGRRFSSDSAFDAHRVGPFTDRRCVEVEETPGWQLTSRGWTNAAPWSSRFGGAS